MGIEYLLSGVCLILVLWRIPSCTIIRSSDLTAKEARLLFVFKVISGVAIAYCLVHFIPSFDYLAINEGGKLQYDLLLTNPKLFFTDFTSDLRSYGLGGIFAAENSFWGYFRFYFLYKSLAILNLLTHGNFYLNAAIFSGIVFFGHIGFYRIYSDIYIGNKLKILLVCFGVPSLLLYTSAVHKDGVVFACLGLVCYCFYQILKSSSLIKIKYLLVTFLGLTIIFLLRNYVIVALIPAVFIAILCKQLPNKKLIIIVASYTVFLIIFFLSTFINSSFNLPAAVVQRKADFAGLEGGNTSIAMNDLHPTLQSFASNFPQAINHYLFRPYLWEFAQTSVLLTAIELLFYQLIIMAFILLWKKPTCPLDNFNILGLLFLFNMMLIIGYTIPNIGAIVRYRSIFWIFLLCPLICNIDWKQLWPGSKNQPLSA
ncbi:hypothetical protein BH11BAC3_BH11BAC3_01080 [soil metagenome]